MFANHVLCWADDNVSAAEWRSAEERHLPDKYGVPVAVRVAQGLQEPRGGQGLCRGWRRRPSSQVSVYGRHQAHRQHHAAQHRNRCCT